MFRITQCIIKSRSLLCYRHPAGIQLAAISHTPPNFQYKNPLERDTCKIPPPPPPPPPKDDTYFWGAVALMILAGGFVVYAKTEPELRDWLTIHAPWLDDFIAFAHQENMTYKEYASQRIDSLITKVTDYLKDDKPKQCSSDGTPVMIGPLEESTDDDEEKEDQTPCERLPAPVVTKDICEIEFCLRDLGDAAYHNYMTARDACSYYNQLVQETMQTFSVSAASELQEAMEERLELVRTHIDNAVAATSQLDELTRYFQCGLKDVPKEAVENTKSLLKEYKDKIKTMSILYEWECDKSLVMDIQWQQVKELVLDKYAQENQIMFPGLNYESKKPVLSGDTDLLLYHTLRYVEKLKAELSESVSGMTERVNRGLATLPQGEKERMVWELQIKSEYAKRKAELDKEYKKRIEDLCAANAKILQQSLKNQLEKSQETLATKCQEKEAEASKNLNKMVAKQIAAEKKLMKRQLAEMALKTQMVEDKLNARLKAERETRRSQELWTAGASLLAATKKGEPYVNVDKELEAIEKASGGSDKLVLTVLKAIPESVRAQGLVPESVLREKYHLMEQTALKVALVEQDGAPLPVYFLSWLQSVLLFMKISGIPRDEIDKPPLEPSKDLDTFDLMQRARFWIERGNIAYALRYVDSLEGASRGAATTWREAARSHLETRQAAEAVLAHAAAMGLQYI